MFMISVSCSGLDDLLLKVKSYDVSRKTDDLRDRMASQLVADSQKGFNGAIADDLTPESGGAVMSNVTVSSQNIGDRTEVVASGDHAVFIEFGAGVHHNGAAGTSPHPNGEALTYLIGSYNNGKGKKDKWALPGRQGKKAKWSYGTPAQMPMYHATEALIQDYVEMAKEVFDD